MDRWRDVKRHGGVLDALEFDDMADDVVDLASKLVDEAKNEVGEDRLLRYEYFPSAEEREQAYGLRPPRKLGDEPRKNGPISGLGDCHYGVFNVYVNVGRLKSMWIDAAIAVGATILTGGSAAPGALAVIARAVASLKILSEDEAELVHVIIAKSHGHAYSRPLPEEQLRAAYREAEVSIDDLVEKLVDRGFAKRRGDGIQLIF